MNIGEKIRIARVTIGYSQEYVAFLLDMSQSNYSKIELNKSELTIQKLYRIAKILNVDVMKLLPEAQTGEIIELNLIYKILLKLWLPILGLIYKVKHGSKLRLNKL